MTSSALFDAAPGAHQAANLPPAFPDRAPRGSAPKLRQWQEEALRQYFEREPRDFLAAATPGAGKTTFALRLAKELLARGTVDRVIVVAPTDHLKRQWAEAAERVAIHLNPVFRNADGWLGRHWHGAALTYAQVGVDAAVHQRITEQARTLVILDEVHHGGDALSWGDAMRQAFGNATRRLLLTGTPFRSDTAPIPFVSYAPDSDGIRTSMADYTYGYRRALEDGVVRPVLFLVYSGSMRWRTSAGEEMSASLGEATTKDITAQAWRTALSAEGEWIPAVLQAADQRLTEVRRHVPDAGGLVIASDKTAARAYAALLQTMTGEPATVVLSDEKEASDRIAAFSAGTSRWLVAVRMVSEGVDVPRLSVGVYATNASTPLFFAQAIGRFVRARKRGESASVFLPNVPVLLKLAEQLELERDHALDRREDGDPDENRGLDEDALTAANRLEKASESLTLDGSFQALGSDAKFDRVLYDGGEFGFEAEVGSEEELEFLGLPGLLEPDQVRDLLKHRQARQQKRSTRAAPPSAPAPGPLQDIPLHRRLKEQRALLNDLVGLWSHRTNAPHGSIHSELRRLCGGPAVAQASPEQLQARIDLLRRRING
ncbi:DEAD/DEAH box helicase [Amnibacterium sp. CER49]|uniref:DEAD/DEAH box helicase n=1 Tax=Amnibacterium sp. CER49 TaxID=3039161 RepID=UPI0024481F6A|nr:DEAD/DEAH box helicase [Amnibacterium sp. CER49]MDH2444452.1 DEAD/DEAH box helicase [Amnibacterium sp. CER49]